MILKQVKSLDELKEILGDHRRRDFRVVLNGGVFSRKSIRWCKDGKWQILNHVDNTRQTLTEAELMDESLTLVGAAIPKGALISEQN
jgi:hypothetical protein